MPNVTAQSSNEDLKRTPIAMALRRQDRDLSDKKAAKSRMFIARSLIEYGANLTIFPEGFNFGGDTSLITTVKESQKKLLEEVKSWIRSPNYISFVELFGAYENKIRLSNPLMPLLAKNEELGITEFSNQNDDQKTMANFLVEDFVTKMARLEKPYQQQKLMRDFQLILPRFSEADRNCIFEVIKDQSARAKKDTNSEYSKIDECFRKLSDLT